MAATGHLLPDLTLVLDIAPDAARRRVGGARDRIEDRPAEYHARVREGFLRAAGESPCPFYPAPIVVIDASAAPEVVAGRIQSEVEHFLAFGPRS
jgi:dTMP kinase